MYAQNAVAVNEFLGNSWKHVSKNGVTIGMQLLNLRAYFPQSYWYWIGVAGLLGYIFLLNILFALALTFLNRKYQVLQKLTPHKSIFTVRSKL